MLNRGTAVAWNSLYWPCVGYVDCPLWGAGSRHAALLIRCTDCQGSRQCMLRESMQRLDATGAGGCTGPVLLVHAPSEARACPGGAEPTTY